MRPDPHSGGVLLLTCGQVSQGLFYLNALVPYAYDPKSIAFAITSILPILSGEGVEAMVERVRGPLDWLVQAGMIGLNPRT